MVRFWRRARPLALALLVLGVSASPAGSPAQAAVPSSPGPAVVLTGSGWGHSVGMSQYGARAMAQQGRSAVEILTYYYPGTDVASEDRVANTMPIRVDVFRNKLTSLRIDLASISATDPTATPASPVTVDLGDGVVRDVPTGAGWWVSHDPAGSRYVLHEGTGEVASGPGPVNVTPGSDSAIKVLNVASSTDPYVGTYRWGVLTITGQADGVLRPVLVQPLQNYLWGIAEVPASWEAAALDAQAITARTYAGRKAGQVISSTPADQAYSGWHKEISAFADAWKGAVDRTSGVAVTYQGQMAETYYSSSNGLGRTESSAESWAFGSARPYLVSVADPFSSAPGNGNPYVSWQATASNVDVARLVGLERVSNVVITSRTQGGSPKTLDVTGWKADGARTTVTWAGAWPARDTRGAGARIRTALPVTGGASNNRVRSQQISSITLAPFTDDEDSVHQYNIGAVAAAGITTGCTPTTYCPKSAVTRGQMATFIARALRLPADTGENAFTDIAASPHRGFINALARAGKVGGYDDRTYRPDLPVTREQMASFLAAGFELPPYSGDDQFGDIATSFHRDRINATAARGIAGGCTPSSYCPKNQVTREQMASFLARATGIGE